MKGRARRCLGIDIGSTSLKVAELSVERSGITTHRLLQAPLDLAPDAPADERWAAIARALRDLLRENKVSTRQAAFALPGHAVFVRRIRLPRTSEERLQRIIRFEARQQIPFPLEQTILQYQISPTDVEDEVEVLLVAIKRELVEHYMAMIRGLGLRPILLGVTSFALFNHHMHSQGVKPEEFEIEAAPVLKTIEPIGEEEELEAPAARAAARGGLLGGLKGIMGKKKARAGAAVGEADTSVAVVEAEPGGIEETPALAFEEVKAYLNIGASTMDLAIGRTGVSHLIGFSRSIPLAGNQLTRVIQDQLRCESFTDAERVKREQAQVLLPGLPPAPENEKASRAIMPTIDRMVAEIRRSLDFYISQPDGMAVDRLMVSGGQATLPNLAAYIEDRIGVPVEVADDSDYLVSKGLALQGLGQAVIGVDFLPEHIKGWIEFKRKNVQLVIQLGLIGAMVFVASMVGEQRASSWRNRSNDMEAQLVGVESLQRTFDKANQDQMLISMALMIIERSHGYSEIWGGDRNFLFSVLKMIDAVRPSDVFMKSVAIGPQGDVVIDAYSVREQSASQMATALGKFEAVENARLTFPATRARAGTRGAAVSFEWQVRLTLKNKTSKIDLPRMPTQPGAQPGWNPPVGPPAPGVPPVSGGDTES